MKHAVQLMKTVTTNDMFSKRYVLFEKGHLNKRAGVWTPFPGSATGLCLSVCVCGRPPRHVDRSLAVRVSALPSDLAASMLADAAAAAADDVTWR